MGFTRAWHSATTGLCAAASGEVERLLGAYLVTKRMRRSGPVSTLRLASYSSAKASMSARRNAAGCGPSDQHLLVPKKRPHRRVAASRLRPLALSIEPRHRSVAEANQRARCARLPAQRQRPQSLSAWYCSSGSLSKDRMCADRSRASRGRTGRRRASMGSSVTNACDGMVQESPRSEDRDRRRAAAFQSWL